MASIQTSTQRIQRSSDKPLTLTEKRRSVELWRKKDTFEAQRLFYALFPEANATWTGPSILGGLMEPGQIIYSRDLYAKNIEFFTAGLTHRERCAMFANRTGKTLGCGGYETSCHLTGLYPDWWEGRKFKTPVSAWVAGDTYETTRDIIQLNLLGEITWRAGRKVMDGRGIIPGALLGTPIWRSGVQNVVDTIPVQHDSGGWSLLGQKSYDQGRKAFQGTGKHVIWFDEEPPMDVYNEALIRTATLNGITMLTFTPLSGLSEVVLSFLPADQRPDLEM